MQAMRNRKMANKQVEQSDHTVIVDDFQRWPHCCCYFPDEFGIICRSHCCSLNKLSSIEAHDI